MKSAMKKLIPRQMLPVARTAYRRMVGDTMFLAAELATPPALKGAVCYNRYGGYFVPESARYRIDAGTVLKGDVWEPDTLEFIRSRCADGGVVHAGTFFGDMLPGICSALAPGARLWAFEPNPESYRCAKVTAAINGLDNIELTRAGLGEAPGRLFLRTRKDDGSSLGGTCHIEECPSGEGETIDIVRIDDVVNGPVSVIHLDVEGHERAALAGALQTLQRCRPILLLEELTDALTGSAWFSENVLSLGYRRTGRVHDNAIFEATTTSDWPAPKRR